MRNFYFIAFGFMISSLSHAQGVIPGKSKTDVIVPPTNQPDDRPETKPVGAITFPGTDFGLKAGDQVVEIDGQAVSAIEGSTKLYTDKGKIHEITVLRDGKRIKVKSKSK